MPIKVACKCGQSFAVKDEMAGKTLKCPKCQQPLPIPARRAAPAAAPAPAQPSHLASLFEEAGLKEHRGPRCPQCGEPLANPNAVLCTHCGFHLQSGQKIAGAKIYREGERGHAEAADNLLVRAEKQIELDKDEAKKVTRTGLPAWVLFIALAGVIGFVTTMFMIPREQAFWVTGLCIACFTGTMSAYYGLRMTIAAFQESTVCGLLYLFMPFYPLYYLVSRWDRVGGFFIMNLAYSVVMGMGFGMMAVAPMLGKKKDEVMHRFVPAVEIKIVAFVPDLRFQVPSVEDASRHV